MATLRPYLVMFRGASRMVNATSQGTAQSHVIKAEVARVKAGVESVRAASGADVAAFFLNGGKIETMGEEPAAAGGLLGKLVAETMEVKTTQGAEIKAGDVLVLDGDTYRYSIAPAGHEPGPDDLIVPEEFEVHEGFITWKESH